MYRFGYFSLGGKNNVFTSVVLMEGYQSCFVINQLYINIIKLKQ